MGISALPSRNVQECHVKTSWSIKAFCCDDDKDFKNFSLKKIFFPSVAAVERLLKFQFQQRALRSQRKSILFLLVRCTFELFFKHFRQPSFCIRSATCINLSFCTNISTSFSVSLFDFQIVQTSYVH